jgi:starvation-inducible outer membrane lipoprotein
MSGCRAFTLAIVVAMPLLLTGCVNAPDELAAKISQSIADGLGSTVSSLVEAAFLAIAI